MVVCLLFFVLIGIATGTIDTVTISMKLGAIKGIRNINNDGKAAVYEFRGIQYGNAPIGTLRFAPAQLNESWNTSTYDATSFGPACIQNNAFESNEAVMDENCLFLNIWTSSTDPDANLPVMIWIHGGGFITGSGSDKTYNAKNVVQLSQNLVIVTLNYRLSVLGFLSNEDLYKEYGNYGGLNGIYDQIQAINWVYKYISGFGGNPNDLTVYGESAGGLSTCMLMISPIVSRQAFKIKRTIIESGSCIGGWGAPSLVEGVALSNLYLTESGYSTNLTKLRTYNATELVDNVLNKSNNLWLPAVDDYILSKTPETIYGEKSINPFNVEEAVIMGVNSMDGVVAYPWNYGPYPKTDSQYKAFLELYVSNETLVDLLYNTYYPSSSFPSYLDHTSASIAYFSINSDTCLTCPSLKQMNEMLNHAGNNIEGYIYLFRGASSPYYAGHASELNFVFDHDYPIENAFFEVDWNKNLSESMVSSWTNFGKYGKPNVTNSNSNVNIEWISYINKNNESNVIIFDDNIRIQSEFKKNYRNNVCDFWYNQVGSKTMKSICQDQHSP